MPEQTKNMQQIREAISILAKEYSIEILQELYIRGWSSASEIARELGIHVATAMRKLAELDSLDLLEKRERTESVVTEYRLQRPQIEIMLSFEEEVSRAAKGVINKAKKLFVKEKFNKNVVVEADEGQQIIRRLVFIRTLRWKTVGRKLELSELEGRFFWHLPFESEKAKSVSVICKHSGITNPIYIARILDFVKEMDRMGVVEIIR